MNKATQHVLMTVSALVLLIAGCSKNTASTAASLVGTWTSTTARDLTTVDGVTTRDTTGAVTGSASRTFTFAADGTASSINSSGTTHGRYTYASSRLTMIDSTGSTTMVFDVTTLTAHDLGLSYKNTSVNNNHTTVDQITYNFTR